MQILVAVDGSDASDAAVAEVAARPWPPNTRVEVISVVPNIAPDAVTPWEASGGVALAELYDEVHKASESFAVDAAHRLEEKGLPAVPLVLHGDPRSAIVEAAVEWDADLIVVGSHGRTGIAKWLLGSVAQSVVSHAACSVEVVRTKRPKDASG